MYVYIYVSKFTRILVGLVQKKKKNYKKKQMSASVNQRQKRNRPCSPRPPVNGTERMRIYGNQRVRRETGHTPTHDNKQRQTHRPTHQNTHTRMRCTVFCLSVHRYRYIDTSISICIFNHVSLHHPPRSPSPSLSMYISRVRG